MTQRNLISDLTPKQKAFIDAYCGDADFSAEKAAKAAGYLHPEKAGYKILESKAVSTAISKRLGAKAAVSWYSEVDIQKALWNEVNTREGRGNTQAARVSALVWLGKSIGMWSDLEQKQKLIEEQRKSPQIQYNIVNYAGELPSKENIREIIEVDKKDVEEQLSLPEGIEIINYR